MDIEIQQKVKHLFFSKRLMFWDELQIIVSKREDVDGKIAYPDVFLFSTQQDYQDAFDRVMESLQGSGQ